jgi:hypothetical protein
MDQDWWNSRVSEQGLKHDLPLVEKALGAGGERFEQIRCWVDLASKEEPQAEAVADALKAAGLLGEGGALPQSSIVASRLSAIAIDSGAGTKDALLARFGEELLKRAKSAPGDAEALNMLCYLCALGKTRERLAEYDRYGWDRYGDVRFAGSLLAGLLAEGKLAGDSPELAKALKQFPEDSTINKIAIRCAGEQGLTAAMLAAAIQSEYRHLSPGMGGYPDSYTLKGYFALLKRKV